MFRAFFESGGGNWLDRWGSIILNKELCAFSEPSQLNLMDLRPMLKLQKLGVRVTVEPFLTRKGQPRLRLVFRKPLLETK